MGRRALAAGAVRMLGSHEGLDGKAYRRAWGALVNEFGAPPAGSLLRLEFGRVAACWVVLEAAQRRLAETRRRRETQKTHRPSEAMVLRLEKRAGLADASYGSAVARLRELAAKRNGHVSPAELVRRADEELRRAREGQHAD